MLKFKWIGHACVLISSKNTKLITDPWFGYPFHFNTFHSFPPFKKPESGLLNQIDIIHISHIHQDHFCKKSLSYFKKDTVIAIAKYENKHFLNEIKSLGFTKVIEIPEGAVGIEFQDLRLKTIITPQEKNFDSVLIVSPTGSQDHFLLNNDCYISDKQFQKIQESIPSFKGSFLGYSPVKPYPTCYDLTKLKNTDVIKKNMADRIQQEQKNCIEYSLKICDQFNVEWMVPYANNLRFLNADLFHHNRIFTDTDLYSSYKLDFLLHTDIPLGSEIDAEGLFLKKKQNFKDSLEDYLQRPSFFTYSDDLIPEYQPKIALLLNQLMNKVSSTWKHPMLVQFLIKGQSRNITVNYSHLIKDENRAADLIVEYQFSDMKRLCDHEYSFNQLHYMYRFNAVVINYIPKQSGVHSWI